MSIRYHRVRASVQHSWSLSSAACSSPPVSTSRASRWAANPRHDGKQAGTVGRSPRPPKRRPPSRRSPITRAGSRLDRDGAVRRRRGPSIRGTPRGGVANSSPGHRRLLPPVRHGRPRSARGGERLRLHRVARRLHPHQQPRRRGRRPGDGHAVRQARLQERQGGRRDPTTDVAVIKIDEQGPADAHARR